MGIKTLRRISGQGLSDAQELHPENNKTCFFFFNLQKGVQSGFIFTDGLDVCSFLFVCRGMGIHLPSWQYKLKDVFINVNNTSKSSTLFYKSQI